MAEDFAPPENIGKDPETEPARAALLARGRMLLGVDRAGPEGKHP